MAAKKTEAEIKAEKAAAAKKSQEKRKEREREIKLATENLLKLTASSNKMITTGKHVSIVAGQVVIDPAFEKLANDIALVSAKIEELQTAQRAGYEFEQIAIDALADALEAGDFLRIVEKDGLLIAERIIVPEGRIASFVLRKVGEASEASEASEAEAEAVNE